MIGRRRDEALIPESGVPEVSTTPDPGLYYICVIEDDLDLQSALEEYLRLQGYRVRTCSDGDDGLQTLFSDGPFDLLLLDVMLPGRSGFEVLEAIRGAGLNLPTVMLTARGDHRDVMRGFDLGADDYVSKPFSADVLDARVRAILSRTKPPAESPMDVHQFGQMTVNFSSNDVYRDGRSIAFTALEFELLRYLINNRRRVVTREQLLRDVWNLPPEVDTRTVDRHIASLRKKIEPERSEPCHILTVYGRGYRFEP